ncbi:MAG: hypothetical protein M1832_005479 [Thelocarpon impressellum]|nr:MAG: hypothetical protein M1832_005479 [Thelocarpon impressellum]
MGVRATRGVNAWFYCASALFLFIVFSHRDAVLPSRARLSVMSSSFRHPSNHKPATGTQSAPGFPLHDADEPVRKGPLDITQRVARSEKAWQFSVDTRHMVRDNYLAMTPGAVEVPLFDRQRLPDFPGGSAYYTVWDFFPPAFSCPWDIQRVGRFADGGKWVCGMSRYEEREVETTIIYSFGVEQDSAFEEAMLSRTNAEIFAYDFTVDDFGTQLTQAHRDRSHFMKIGLSGEDKLTAVPPFYTLSSLMRVNGHSYIDILKIDVEGSEYDAFDRLMDDFEGQDLPIGQIMIEIHLFDDENVGFGRFYDWWERLESFGMRPTWLEVNLIQITLRDPNAPSHDPRCTEIVWVNTKDPRSILLKE